MDSKPEGGERLLPAEAEAFVSELRAFQVEHIGSDKWTQQRERIERLHLQAYHNIIQNSDEFVKDFIISYNKLSVLINELLVIEVWREKVFPLMLKNCKSPTSSFLTYIILYFETVIAGLLEILLYYRESCEIDDTDCFVDLVDYCHRRITELLSESDREEREEIERGEEELESGNEDNAMNSKNDIIKELKGHCKSFELNLTMSSVSIIKYITDHFTVLPLAITSRLLNTHDTPCLLVHLMQKAPWKRTDGKGSMERYDDKWVAVVTAERMKLSKVEGQVWLTLYQLLLSEHCQQKYEYNDNNKITLLKLRAYLIEPILEQIPALVNLQRYLEHLAIMEPPASKRQLILEQVPVIRDQLLRASNGHWEKLADKHISLLLEPDTARVQKLAKGWVNTFGDQFMEPSTCSACGKEATKRCSKCRMEWYCSRECQVKDWKKHKPLCLELAK